MLDHQLEMQEIRPKTMSSSQNNLDSDSSYFAAPYEDVHAPLPQLQSTKNSRVGQKGAHPCKFIWVRQIYQFVFFVLFLYLREPATYLTVLNWQILHQVQFAVPSLALAE